ncbi:hypothetical protein Avbf_05811 [Armadillidium vulgare]|nr:hypothetical protein Avbf_05811 [Armadillidium vulgare]
MLTTIGGECLLSFLLRRNCFRTFNAVLHIELTRNAFEICNMKKKTGVERICSNFSYINKEREIMKGDSLPKSIRQWNVGFGEEDINPEFFGEYNEKIN